MVGYNSGLVPSPKRQPGSALVYVYFYHRRMDDGGRSTQQCCVAIAGPRQRAVAGLMARCVRWPFGGEEEGNQPANQGRRGKAKKEVEEEGPQGGTMDGGPKKWWLLEASKQTH